MLFRYGVCRRMYRFAPLQAYRYQGYGHWSGYSSIGPYLDFAFDPRLREYVGSAWSMNIETCFPPLVFSHPKLATYQCRRYAWIAYQEGAIWRPTDTDKGCH